MKQQIFFSIFSPGKKIYTSCSINLCIFVACHICQAGFVPVHFMSIGGFSKLRQNINLVR